MLALDKDINGQVDLEVKALREFLDFGLRNAVLKH